MTKTLRDHHRDNPGSDDINCLRV